MAVLDSVVRVVPTQAYDTMSAVDWSRHAALLDDEGFLRITLDGCVVRSADRPGKNATMPGGKMLDNLRASGTASEEITDVVFTHLHVDHVGWDAVADQRMFPTRHIVAMRPTGTTSSTVARWVHPRSWS